MATLSVLHWNMECNTEKIMQRIGNTREYSSRKSERFSSMLSKQLLNVLSAVLRNITIDISVYEYKFKSANKEFLRVSRNQDQNAIAGSS